MMANGDIKDLWNKVTSISEEGCALRKGDDDRMSRIERSNERIHQRLDWIMVFLIGNLAALVTNFAMRWAGK
jgi:hypothetical protein